MSDSSEYSSEEEVEAEETGAKVANISAEDQFKGMDMDAEAEAKYQTVTFAISQKFNPSDFISSDGTLKNNGRLIISSKKMTIALARFNPQDFQEFGSAAFSTTTTTGTKGKKKMDAPHYKDVIKAIRVKNMTSDWGESLVMSFDTVPALPHEGMFDKSKFVNWHFMPKTIRAMKPKDFMIISRSITNRTMAFHQIHPEARASNFDKDIVHCPQGYSLIPMKSPAIMVYNGLPTTTKKIEKPNIPEYDQYQMPTPEAKQLIELTRSRMASQLSTAAITGDEIAMSFYTPMPPNFTKIQAAYEKTKTGKQWKGFADPSHVQCKFQGSAQEQEIEMKAAYKAFLAKEFFIHCHVEMDYFTEKKLSI